MEELYTISMNVSDNVWRTSLKEFSFNRSYINETCRLLTKVCSKHTEFTASYNYDKFVFKILAERYQETFNKKAYYTVVKNTLPNFIKDESWYDGARAAIRCIESRLAYMTPGFLEAKIYHELYGS